MDDINFDELDKAVNSVLQQKPKKGDEAQESPVESTLEVVKDDLSAEEPITTTAVEVEPEKKPDQKTPQLVVPKRRGQFMDLVHPSSDMTSPTESRTTPVPRLNRQSNTLQPLDPSIVEMSKEEPQPSSSAGEEEKVTEKDVSPGTEEPKLKSPIKTTPDPVESKPEKTDVASTAEEKDEPVAKEKVDETVTQTEGDFTEPDSEGKVEDEPAHEAPESPFIKGTEVEKRPLSAFAEPHDETEEVKKEAKTEEDDNPEAEAPSALPQELSPEIVSVESDDPTRMTEELTDDEPSPMSASIAKQYKTVDAQVDDEESHPVFDTKDYHRPLTPPAKKKKSGVMAVILLVLLAALGAGAWYAIAVLKLI